MSSPITNCQYARQRHKNLVRWLNLWTILLFVFGTVIVVVLALAIARFHDPKVLEQLAAALGAVASGVAMGWVRDRRNDAKAEEAEAWRDVTATCDSKTDGPTDDPRPSYRLFGRWL